MGALFCDVLEVLAALIKIEFPLDPYSQEFDVLLKKRFKIKKKSQLLFSHLLLIVQLCFTSDSLRC